MISHTAGYATGPDAVYYDRLTPDAWADHPHVVMLHGGGHTGSCFMATASGTPGWAYRFAERGYSVTIPDWPGHGRSGALDLRALTGDRVCQSLANLIFTLDQPIILLAHSMGAVFAWRLVELCRDRIVTVVGVAPGPPGNIQPQPQILSEDTDGLTIKTPFRTVTFKDEGPSAATKDFVTKKLVGNSRQFPVDNLDTYTRRLTYTGSRLLYERLNIFGSQLKISDTSSFAGKRMLIVTGEEDIEHPRHVDEEIACWFAAQGALTQFAWLPDQNISGNGHMMMLERNSDQIAYFILDWLDYKPIQSDAYHASHENID